MRHSERDKKKAGYVLPLRRIVRPVLRELSAAGGKRRAEGGRKEKENGKVFSFVFIHQGRAAGRRLMLLPGARARQTHTVCAAGEEEGFFP